MHLPYLLPSNPPALSDQLRRRTDQLRSRIVKTNYNTQFAQIALELAEFRHATAGCIDGMDDDSLSETFQKTVHFTAYDSYTPFTAKFLEERCKASAVVDMLAPGLPDCLSHSSSTSGGLKKVFPKYNILSQIRSSNVGLLVTPDPLRKRTRAYLYYIGIGRMSILDEDDCSAATVYLTSGSVIKQRLDFHLDPEEDQERMGTFILDHAAPYAAGFIVKWSSFLLIHVLFAISSRSLESIGVVFTNTLVDMMRYVDTKFDMIVDCIANGTIPDLEGIAEVRHYLEMNISPDPERAEELRRIGRPSSRPGWCAHVWPNFRSVTAIASGPFASSVPLLRQFFGPDIKIHSHGYACTEAWIGSPYSPLDVNQFKLSDKNIFEFLDVSGSDSISALAQLWDVQLGRRYEIVLTTTDGLWRYRLGDVVEICGFDPTDGVPVIQFVERRNVAIRLPACVITEKELRAAMSHVPPNTLINWTAAIDTRQIVVTIAFFVELAGDVMHDSSGGRSLVHDRCFPLPDLALALDHVFDDLVRSNEALAWELELGRFRKPILRVVRPGTFSEFLQLKLDEGSRNVGQVKVPVALPKPEYVTWFSEWVVHEL